MLALSGPSGVSPRGIHLRKAYDCALQMKWYRDWRGACSRDPSASAGSQIVIWRRCAPPLRGTCPDRVPTPELSNWTTPVLHRAAGARRAHALDLEVSDPESESDPDF
ncbi:hypothetical protein PsYK624_033270 [Phanerochaete sordida]|uniref:Uncharacterized protein n=1 Tax=Phanerochaete sordida TaxID=48140 RepID=A0A9P3G441_9APHY|nr:hypothetical protein PsYK624_033270 [Phanerochaete sordida]